MKIQFDLCRLRFLIQHYGRHYLLLIVILLLVGSCGGTQFAEIPLVEGKGGIFLGGTFRWNSTEDIRSLDPIRIGDVASGDAGIQIYDGLVEFDRQLNIVPGLAEKWEISEEGTQYTFHLRKGVRFHDNACFPNGVGREMDASDVVYSLQRVVDPKSESIGLWVFRDVVVGVEEFRVGQADRVTGFEVLGPYTFRIQLVKPYAPFMQQLCMSYAWIVPHEAVEMYGIDFFRNPVGTGPFQFVSWTKDLQLVLERNPHYWQVDEYGNQLPYLGRIINTFIKTSNTEFQEFELGNLDTHNPVADDLFESILDADGNLTPKYRDRFNVFQSDIVTVYYFGFNMQQEPFAHNKKLRQAINYAIDREAIIRTVLKGRATSFTGIVPPGMPGWKSTCNRYEYNPELAKQLMTEAGYPNGQGLPELECILNSGGKRNERISEVVQQQLADHLGVKTRLQILEWPQYLDTTENNRAIFWRAGWQADYLDPENFLALLDSRKFGPEGPNHTRYSNPEFDALFQQAESEMDAEKRFDLLRRAEEIAVDDAPWLFMHHMKEFRLNHLYVHNLEHNSMAMPFFKYTWIEPH